MKHCQGNANNDDDYDDDQDNDGDDYDEDGKGINKKLPTKAWDKTCRFEISTNVR